MKRLVLLLALCTAPLFATGHQYWRLNGLSANLMAIGNVVFYDAGGSVISTSGGTASASSTFGGQPASNAFLGNTNCSTFWLANAANTVSWLEMAFTSAVAVDHVGVTIGCNGGRGFGYYVQLQFSDDNSTWTTLNEWDGVDAGGTNPTYTLQASNALPTSIGIYWRLSWSLTSSCVGASSIQFFTGPNATGIQATTSRYAAIASSIFNDATAAYDGISLGGNGVGWESENGATTTRTWTYAFSNVQTVGSVQFSNGSTGGCGQVSNLAVSYSSDNVTYTSAGSFSPTWIGTQTKTFNLTGGPSGFVPGVGAFVVGP